MRILPVPPTGIVPVLAFSQYARYRKYRPGSFTDAEGGENTPQQVVRGEGAGDLVQRLLGRPQVLGEQLAGGVPVQLIAPARAARASWRAVI